MAITKILHINEVDTGNPARHLEQALDYIQNPEKQMKMFWWAVLTACRKLHLNR